MIGRTSKSQVWTKSYINILCFILNQNNKQLLGLAFINEERPLSDFELTPEEEHNLITRYGSDKNGKVYAELIRSWKRTENHTLLSSIFDQFLFTCEDNLSFEDCTDEVNERLLRDPNGFENRNQILEDEFGYITEVDENGEERYGFYYNPDGRFDYYTIAEIGYLLGKDGKEYDVLRFDDVDWDNLIDYNLEKSEYRYPFFYYTTEGEWRQNTSQEFKFDSDWKKDLQSYIETIKSKPEPEREKILVYTVDIHP